MQHLEIGQRVIVRAISTVGYVDDVTRTVMRNSIVPVDAIITGQVIRRLGRYQRARGVGMYPDEDYAGAELHVTGSVTLWAVRMGMLNKEQFVQDADLEPGSLQPYIEGCYFELPKRAKRLTYIASPEEPVVVKAGEVKRITFREPILLQ